MKAFSKSGEMIKGDGERAGFALEEWSFWPRKHLTEFENREQLPIWSFFFLPLRGRCDFLTWKMPIKALWNEPQWGGLLNKKLWLNDLLSTGWLHSVNSALLFSSPHISETYPETDIWKCSHIFSFCKSCSLKRRIGLQRPHLTSFVS